MARRTLWQGPRERSLHCSTCPNRQCTEWHVLDEAQVGRLDAAKMTVLYAPGDPIYFQGSPATGLYCVESGLIGEHLVDEAGNSVLVRLTGGGMILGAKDFFAGKLHAATAQALAPATVCYVDAATVNAQMAANAQLGLRFIELLAVQVSESDESLLYHLTRPVRARLARLLVSLHARNGGGQRGHRVVVELPKSRQALAEMLGTRLETVVRTLRTLSEDGLIDLQGRRVEIPDLQRLFSESACGMEALAQAPPAPRTAHRTSAKAP